MTSQPTKLLRRVHEESAAVDPSEFARTLRSSPRDGDMVGEALVAIEQKSRPAAVEAVADCLAAEDVSIRRGSALALRDYADVFPAVDEQVVQALATALTDEDHVVRKHAGVALSYIARARPAAAVAVVDQLHALIDPNRPDLLASGLDIATVVAETDPEAAVPLLDPLFDALGGLAERDVDVSVTVPSGASRPAKESQRQHLTEFRRQRGRIVNVVATVLVRKPDSVERVSDVLADALDHEGLGTHRAVLAEAVGQVAEKNPGAVAQTIEPLAEMLDESDPSVAASAAWALSALANTSTERVVTMSEAHVESVVALLDTDMRQAQIAGANLLAYIGEYHPETTRAAVDGLVDLLDETDPDVRATAALALGHIGAMEALPALRELLDDPKEQVRSTADRAIDRIEDAQ